jgi:hypothetical protein
MARPLLWGWVGGGAGKKRISNVTLTAGNPDYLSPRNSFVGATLGGETTRACDVAPAFHHRFSVAAVRKTATATTA